MRLKRRNFAWLTVLGAAVVVAVLSVPASPLVTVTLLGIYFAALAATILDFAPEQLLDRSRSSLTLMRMSPEAREAVERARRRGSVADDSLTLLDVGLITSQANREGMNMRRTRSVSLDDDGVRPFVSLYVQADMAEHLARIRFEMIDGAGQQQYVHEMRTNLRDGEMNILADHHLPLFDNRQSLQAGDWDLRVYIDGKLIGAHTFTLTPSLNDRFGSFEQRSERLTQRDQPEETATSLEELLRSRSNRGS
jgi:hypothetical protein